MQSSTEWDVSSPLFQYVNNSPYDSFWYTSKAGDLYHIFAPNFTDRYLQANSNDGILLSEVRFGTNPHIPALVLRVHTNYRKSLGGGKVGDLIKHTECFYYKANWCGDGLLQLNRGEQCDPKDPNRTGWGTAEKGCDATCKPVSKVVIPPACNAEYTTTQYNPSYPAPRLNGTMKLCKPGEVIKLQGPDAQGNYTWGCLNDGVSTADDACKAKDLWCGDGKKNGPEQCDPKDPNKAGWGNGGCDATCKPIINENPKCDTVYHGSEKYNPNYPKPRIEKNPALCNPGEVVNFIFDVNTGKYTWTCNGKAGTNPAFCQAKDLWCGDGKKNGPEQCDPKDPNKIGWGTAEKGCDVSCKPVNKVIVPPACNAEYTTTQYNPTYPSPRLNGTMKLCKPGEVIKFQGPDTQGNYTWGCVNDGVSTADDACKAKDLWCGDGKKNGPEQCDPKDPNKIGWGDGGCDATCKPITKPKPEPQCNSQYHGKVGYASHYPPTPWLHTGMNLCNPGQIVDFQGPDAQGFFAWKCKGEVGTSVAECQARQERCGDGKKNGPEQCDPKDPNKAGWGKGGCDATCKPIHKEDPKVYDLALTKKLATKKTSYELGDLVDFEITVYNQGQLAAKNIEVTEYLPNGLLLEDSAWTQNGNKASFLIRETLLPGQQKTIKLRMRIADNFTGTKILNKAEISKDNAGDYGTTDSDSTPDQNADNDCIVGEDNHYIDGNGKAGGACTPPTDEDDHDIVPILIKKPDLPVVPPYIEKELQGDKNHKYQVGELVGFKMPFGNTGSQMIKKVKIRDILPLNLEYVSSEIHGVQPYTKGLYASGKLQILEYSGFNLAPGQQGYLLMTGRVLADYQDARVNRVGIYENDYLRDWDDESYQIAPKAVKIEKTVDKSQVFSGEVVEFTIKVFATEGKFTTLKVVDTLPKGLVFVPDTQLLTGQTTETKLVSFATGVNRSGLETLTWELNFPKGFKKSDFFLLKLKAKLLETSKTTYTNIACVFNPDDPQNPSCDPEDVKPRLEDVKLKIKKYVSDAVGGTWIDDSKQFSNGATAFFKLVISSASAPLTGFRVTDRIEGNLSYLDSSDLANNAFTGLITFGANNPTKPAYTITPKVTTGVNFTDLEWKVSMGSGFFMPGDSLVLIFKTKKNGNQTNIGHVYYPRPNGSEGHDQDPASVTTPSG